MSQRYLGGWIQDGLFNPLATPTGIPAYTYELWSWGQGANGALGLGNTTNYSSPKQVGALTTWSKISTGNFHTLAIKTNGTLWSWGNNQYGQLGLGTSGAGTYKSSPTQVGALTTWLNIACGDFHSLAVKTDGTLWSWGNNSGGQLGLGNTTSYSSPKQVGTLTTWSVVAGGYTYTLATKTDGTLWSWGSNDLGQLGQGNTTILFSPVQVGALTTWSKVVCGNKHTIATKTDGTLWSWGQGTAGQLGRSTTTNYSSPVQVGALTTWLNIACGYVHTLATKTNGTLWVWGGNNAGQLGLGTSGAYTNQSSPVQVGALTTWSTVSGAGTNIAASLSGAIKTDGTLWSWGFNTSGQLGQGNTTNRSSPVQVGALTTWYAVSTGPSFTIALKY